MQKRSWMAIGLVATAWACGKTTPPAVLPMGCCGNGGGSAASSAAAAAASGDIAAEGGAGGAAAGSARSPAVMEDTPGGGGGTESSACPSAGEAACEELLSPVFYVGPSGDDRGPGTREAPLGSIGGALTRTSVGTIVVLPGTYRERLAVPQRSATCAPLQIMALPGAERPVITSEGAASTDRQDLLYLEGQRNVCVRGFAFVGSAPVEDASAIRIYGSGRGLKVLDNDISAMRGESAMGITVYGTDGEGVSDLRVVGNHVHDCEPAPSEALVVNGNVHDFVVSDNHVHDVNNIGIDVIGGEQWLSAAYPSRGLVLRNRVERANSSYEDGSAAGIYVDGASELLLAYNQVSGCDFGLEVGAENPGVVARHVVVHSNFIHHNYKGGIIFGGYDADRGRVADSAFVHNTLYANARPGELTAQGFSGESNGEVIIQYAVNCSIQNNILVGAAETEELISTWGLGENLTVNSNLFYVPGSTAEEVGLGVDASAWWGDPALVDAAGGNLHLGLSSRAEGRALPLTLEMPSLSLGVGSLETQWLDIDGEARGRDGADLGADEVP